MKTTTLALVFSVLVMSSICQDSKGKTVSQTSQSQFQGKGGASVLQTADQSQFQGKGGKTPIDIPTIIPAPMPAPIPVVAASKHKGIAAFIQQDSKGKTVSQTAHSQFQGKGGASVGTIADQSQFQGKGSTAVGQTADQSQFQGKGGKTPIVTPIVIPAVFHKYER